MEGRGWVHVLSAGVAAHTRPPARPQHPAWTRAEERAPLAERGLHLLSSQVLTKVQRVFAPCSWRLRSAPAGSPRPRLPGLSAASGRRHGDQGRGNQRAVCPRPGRPEGRLQRCSGSRAFPSAGLGGRSPRKGDRAFRGGDACFRAPTQVSAQVPGCQILQAVTPATSPGRLSLNPTERPSSDPGSVIVVRPPK